MGTTLLFLVILLGAGALAWAVWSLGGGVRDADADADAARDPEPASRGCVTVVGDWRDYHATAQAMPRSQLVMTFEAYYAHCEQLAADAARPPVRAHVDWLADEMIATFYADEASAAALVEAACRFAVALVRSRAEFARVHGLPRSLDVGLAAGTSLVGRMGPGARKKLTALGDVPGRARRFHGAGKLLRKNAGDKDRIILGRECAAVLGDGWRVTTVPLAPGESVRDAADRELFVLDPDASTPTPLREVA